MFTIKQKTSSCALTIVKIMKFQVILNGLNLCLHHPLFTFFTKNWTDQQPSQPSIAHGNESITHSQMKSWLTINVLSKKMRIKLSDLRDDLMRRIFYLHSRTAALTALYKRAVVDILDGSYMKLFYIRYLTCILRYNSHPHSVQFNIGGVEYYHLQLTIQKPSVPASVFNHCLFFPCYSPFTRRLVSIFVLE